MKIGLIADIHGNIQALTAVLAQLYAAQVDMVLCAGDLVGYGAHPNAVIELLRSCGIPSVAGNYDAAVAWQWPQASRHPTSPATECLQQAALDWVKQTVHSKHKDYLRSLQLAMQYRLDNLSLHILHAGPNHLDEWVTPDQSDDLVHLAACIKADVVILGHTHTAFVHESVGYMGNKTLFINTGAVGRALDGDTRAAYAIFDTVSRQVTLKRVAYDLEIAVRAVMNSGMPVEIALLLQHGVGCLEQIPQMPLAMLEVNRV
ncbi:MAG: metallophosphatase family protein [Chloroflexota bacterium]|nr:metallophosphatase family protein [Chloroflexota bacterium]